MHNVDFSSSQGQCLQRISRHHSVTSGDHLGIACKLVRITDGVAHVRWSKFGLHAAPSLRLLYTCIDHVRNLSSSATLQSLHAYQHSALTEGLVA